MIRENVSGSIVNVGSVAGTGGPPKLVSYSMSNGALAVLTTNLAFMLPPHHIRVNQVNPGWMDTENEHHIQLVEDGQPEDWLATAEAGRPLGRLIKPWKVATAIAFCLSRDTTVRVGTLRYSDGCGPLRRRASGRESGWEPRAWGQRSD